MHGMGEVKHVSLVAAPLVPLASTTVMNLSCLLARPVRRALFALVVLTAVTACDDPFEITASQPNLDATFELWALTGSPSAYPSGLLVPQASVVRLDASGSFDLAFDIDADGRLKVLPVGSVVSPLSGSRVIGFQRGEGFYNSIVEAPRAGWTNDTLLLMNEGQTFLVKVNTAYCQFDIRQDIYAKFYVDSVIPAERRVKLLGRVNPNCGFRALTSGIPEF